jgi:hypothetical protein
MKRVPVQVCSLLLLLICGVASNLGATMVGPWVPMFKGVDHSVSTNTPGGSIPRLQVVNALRVDLTDPDIRFETTPRLEANYLSGSREVIGLTVSDFLKAHDLQAAINANFFAPGVYYPPPGTVMDIHGLSINQGTNVSAATSGEAATLLFDAQNQCTLIPFNWPPKPMTNVFTAISGDIAVLTNGINRMTQSFDIDPRTVFGLSADRRYLFIVAIDGRQSGYSDGASFYDCAQWLKLLGASDAINVDGGGSTTLVIEDTTGVPVRLNRSSAVADSGRERTVGSHFGIHAKPLPAFINDVEAIPEDTSAIIKWITLEPATSEVRYGLSTDFELGSVTDTAGKNIHSVSLTGLTPATTYYFQVLSATAAQQFVSSNFVFVTTNYVTTNTVFGLGQTWKYSFDSMDGVNWTARDYDDSAWSSGAGVLWADTRATPNPAIQNKSTQMPGDPNTGFPYVTYYFRSTFVLTNIVPGSSLLFSGNVDDGAAFYVNGTNTYLLRMPPGPVNSTIAIGFPCAGDADCVDQFTIAAASNTNLVVGTNVVAVEVHNYNARSPDITFGLGLDLIEPIKRDIQLTIGWSTDKISIEWEGSAILQSAPAVEGPWEDVAPAAGSPMILQPSGSGLFYRLRRSP